MSEPGTRSKIASKVWFSFVMKTTVWICAERWPGSGDQTGERIRARSARASTRPLSASTVRVEAASSASLGIGMVWKLPWRWAKGSFATCGPALGPLPYPLKQMQARLRPSGEGATR